MPTLTVGSAYHPSRTSWPECAQYNYRSGAHELVLFLGSPSPTETEACKSGQAHFALYARDSLLLLLYELSPGLPWSDAPYSWHLLPAHERDLPSADLGPEARAHLTIVLVDANTGLVRALRLVSFSHEFTVALHAAIRAQAAHAFDAKRYDRELAALYARCSTAKLLELCPARCLGGAE